MANVKFVYKHGAGRQICSSQGVLSMIRNEVTNIENKANAMATSPHGHGKPYGSSAFLDKKGMARGFVGTRNIYGVNNNLKHNTLLKAFGS